MKVKFANRIYEVLFTKELAGLTVYAVEDEPNHIDWLINVEVIDAENRELKKVEQNHVWGEEDKNVLEDIEEAIINYWHGDTQDILLDWLKSLKERILPKPNWSEDDNHYYGIIQYILNNECVGKTDRRNAIKWFNSLKDRILPQPEQEWNEEEEVKMNRIVACLENLNVADNDILLKDVGWFKSLKERVQSQWKPSDEQMIAINTAINVLGKGTLNGKQLIELQEALKKLK